MNQRWLLQHFNYWLLQCLLLLCAWLFINQAVADNGHEIEKGTVINLVSDVWAGDINADGSGTYVDLLALVYKDLGYSLNHQIVPTRRAVAMMNQGGEVDLMLADWDYKYLSQGGIYVKDKIMTPKMPLGMEYVVAVFASSTKYRWQDIYLNPTRRIGWVRGFNYHWHLNVEKHDTTRVLNNVQGMKMLVKGNLDCFIDDRDVFESSRKQQGFAENFFRTEVLMSRKLYPVFANTPKGRLLMEVYDKRMSELKASGKLQVFYQQRGKDYRELERVELEPVISQ